MHLQSGEETERRGAVRRDQEHVAALESKDRAVELELIFEGGQTDGQPLNHRH